MRYVRRHFEGRLRALLREFPVVCVLGPRQCGKTTFIRRALAGWRYLDLERPSDLARLEDDPEDALRRWGEKVVFDEAQRLPALFPVLRSHVDEAGGRKGRVVLLGSASFGLVRDISESLAGRVGFLDMTPFHVREVGGDWETLWIRGGFPGAYLRAESSARIDWFEGYLRTFVERDLNQLGLPLSSVQIRRFMAMLAHHHGGLLNASELGRSLGVTYHTVHRYLEILEQTFLARRLLPYHANVGKRLVKSPKVYLRDSGLLHFLLRIHEPAHLEGHPKRGAGWEGFVVEQVVSHLALHSAGTETYFWKTATGEEVDLLLKRGNRLLPIEIKVHSAPQRKHLRGIEPCMRDLNAERGYVIRPEGGGYSLGGGIEVLSLGAFLEGFERRRIAP